jgi:hypothetical protein
VQWDGRGRAGCPREGIHVTGRGTQKAYSILFSEEEFINCKMSRHSGKSVLVNKTAPYPRFPFFLVSFTHRQHWSENIKGKILESNNS